MKERCYELVLGAFQGDHNYLLLGKNSSICLLQTGLIFSFSSLKFILTFEHFIRFWGIEIVQTCTYFASFQLSQFIFLFQSLKRIASEYYNSWHGIPVTSTLPRNCMRQYIFADSMEEFSSFCLIRLVFQDTLCQLSLLRNSSFYFLP